MAEDTIATQLKSKRVSSLGYGVTPVALLFATVYAAALTLVYIEGDDATSVVYHAMGRDVLLQPPYSAYHGMMDLFLAVLPPSEIVVRTTAIALSAAAAALLVGLIVTLIQDWLPAGTPPRAALTTIFLLACTPEMFYLGLVYTPSLVAMGFVLAAHILIRTACRKILHSEMGRGSFAALFVLSALLFGVGTACRWDVGIYLLFIAVDLILNNADADNFKEAVKIGALYALFAGAASLLAIFGSGYGFGEILETLALAKKEVLSSDSWFATIGAYQTFFTPAFVVFFVVGYISLLRKSRRLALLIGVGLFSVAPYLFSREPKMILPALPGLWVALAAGIDTIFPESDNRLFTGTRTGIILLMLLPWVIGFQINSGETSWGPGFEIKTPGQAVGREDGMGPITNRVDDRSVAISNWKVGFRGGFAIPTPEGPRPLGGHLFVLLNGEWRKLATNFDIERKSVIDTALDTHYNILQDEGNSFIVAKFLENGFETRDPKLRDVASGTRERVFVNENGDTVSLQILRVRKSLFSTDQLVELKKLNPAGKVILYSGYSSTLMKLADTAPDSLVPLGPLSAVVDLEKLSNALAD